MRLHAAMNLGFRPLTPKQRRALLAAGYVLDTNVHGDEIAKAPKGPWFNLARYELEKLRSTTIGLTGKAPVG